MIGVCIPAHDEEASIDECVASVWNAARHPRLARETVRVVVVADGCSDSTVWRAARAGAMVLDVGYRNVGAARAAGADFLISCGARWLAFTDADSTVAPDWLAEQLALDAEVVCGTVSVEDWSPHGEHGGLLQWHFSQTYFDLENHRHVHGANLGVSASAYTRVGGFRSLATSEDVALVSALEACGARIAWTARPRVVTSARKQGRASGGFADALTAAVRQRLAERSASLASLSIVDSG